MALKKVKEAYCDLVLCGMQDPFDELMRDKTKKIVAGPKGSNLYALVKIRNSGYEARYYRQVANKALFEDKNMQLFIESNLLGEGDTLVVSTTQNPFVRRKDGTVVKLCWHHSPNHINSISLIPQSIHLAGRRSLHIKGRGGNSMYTVPGLQKHV